jgi:hypothetical protein
MKEAFARYLSECKDKDGEKCSSSIDELYKKYSKKGISIFEDITDIDKFNENIVQLREFIQSEEPTGLSLVEGEDVDKEELLDLYQEFLSAFNMFFELWDKPPHLIVKEDEIGKNTIVFGAPGTGKSHYIKEYIKTKTGEKDEDKQPKVRTTFHPDSDYASFVGCYKPTKNEGNDDLTYEFVPQAFTDAYIKAWTVDNPYFLVIEEINRGNCAQIFGDLFQLLDRNEEGLSVYPIKADQDLGSYLKKKFADCSREDMPQNVKDGEQLCLPPNLWILATMNTSDQSLYPMDSAFKRRWDWKYIPFEKNEHDDFIFVDEKFYSWSKFLDAINIEIKKVTESEDKLLGYWFINAGDSRVINTSTFVNKVLFYLWNDIFKDDDTNPFKQQNLTFQSFFKSGNKFDNNNIVNFLEHGLGLSEEEGMTREKIQKRSELVQPTKASKRDFVVTYNGKRYDSRIAIDNFVNVINKIINDVGIDAILSVERGGPKIAQSSEVLKRPITLNNGMFMETNLSNEQKENILNKLKESLNLTLSVNENTD